MSPTVTSVSSESLQPHVAPPEPSVRTQADAVLEGSTRVFLVRHGRTALNAAGRLRGRLDPPLDSAGEEEARRLGALLARESPRIVVASPLRRALDTARAIAADCRCELKVEERFVDRDYGVAAGLTLEEALAAWGSLEHVPGVEPHARVVERALEGLAELASHLDGAAGVIVAHDAVNRALLWHLAPTRWPSEAAVPQRTGCYNVLVDDHGAWRVDDVDVVPGDS